jgi:hypothetical protein
MSTIEITPASRFLGRAFAFSITLLKLNPSVVLDISLPRSALAWERQIKVDGVRLFWDEAGPS